jgi:hypothetical protein
MPAYCPVPRTTFHVPKAMPSLLPSAFASLPMSTHSFHSRNTRLPFFPVNLHVAV